MKKLILKAITQQVKILEKCTNELQTYKRKTQWEILAC